MSKWCGDENCLQCADKEPDPYVHLPREEYVALREQNRVLREALQEIYEGRWTPGVSCCYEDDARDIYPTREMRIRNIAMAALTATSQPTAAEVHQRMFDHGDATSQEGQHEAAN